MALSNAQKKFIASIATLVKKYAPRYGIQVYSPIIAQAILESGWGESKLAAQYHNYFGLKCGTAWKGKSVNMTTKEEYSPGTLTTIKDNFRVYDSMEAGVKGYFEFIQLARYQNLKGIKDPKKYLETIRADGYATSSAYVGNVYAVIVVCNLTQYDPTENSKNDKKEKVTAQQIIDDAVDFAVQMANDNTHGYSQVVRSLYNISAPKSFDCSSLVLTAYYYAFMKNGLSEQAAFLKQNCGYTGNMLQMKKCGFEVVATKQTAHARMKKGDVELADNNPDGSNSHVALAIDGDNIVHARSSEGSKNTIDDSGNEIRTQPWYLYSHGWTHRLRFTGKGLSMVKNTTDSAKKPQATQPVNTAAPSYLVGSTYTLQVDSLNVRTGAGVQYHAKKWNELTANARQHAYTNGQLKKGTRVTCQGTKRIGDDIWMKIPSGWIAAYYEKKTYVQ